MISLLVAGLLALNQPPSAIYLNCTVVEAHGADPSKWYPASVSADEQKVIRDGLEVGAAGFIVRDPTTWAIDFTKGEIGTPDGSDPHYTIDESSPAAVAGRRTAPSGSWFSFRFNRINNRLTLTRAPTEELRQRWKETTGGEMPVLITTAQQCTRINP